jgi:hypothetical protein
VRGNPHAAFDVAGAGNVAWSRWCDTRRRKGEPTGNTNIDLNRRVSPRPYCQNGSTSISRSRHSARSIRPERLFGLFWPLTIAQSDTRVAAVVGDEFGVVPER